jgi:hypothetical protein
MAFRALALLLLLAPHPAFADHLCKKGERPKGRATAPGKKMNHGYWCGIGNLGWDSCWVDELDRVCREHDLCERQNWRKKLPQHSCECDLKFIRDAEPLNSFFALVIKMRNPPECLEKLKQEAPAHTETAPQ